MAGIRNKVSISWKGEEYSLLITMTHVDEIESEGFNLCFFASEVESGNCMYSKLSWLIAKFLRMAGAEVTQDDVWCAIFGSGEFNPADAINTARTITSACFPNIPNSSKKKSPKKK